VTVLVNWVNCGKPKMKSFQLLRRTKIQIISNNCRYTRNFFFFLGIQGRCYSLTFKKKVLFGLYPNILTTIQFALEITELPLKKKITKNQN
jgi:hypothetical protein